MRTTLNLDDDVLQLLKSYASDRSIALGEAASELVRRGFEAPLHMRLENGFYVVDLPQDEPKVSSERVRELLEDEI